MKPVEVIEIYLPVGQDFGWMRTRGRWGGKSTRMIAAAVLEGMAEYVMANPQARPVVDPADGMRSREYANTWPPSEPARAWLVRAETGSESAWVKRV